MGLGGIDLGGTKIEAKFFDTALQEVTRRRIATPQTYMQLIDAIVAQVRWLEEQGPLSHVGLGTPGLINPDTGRMLAANLPVTGETFAADLAAAAGRSVPIINDSKAFTLSEAVHGAGQGFATVVGLVIGTGLACGVAIDGQVLPDLNGQQGEVGHLPLPADLVALHDLPLLTCGCGLTGCFETLIAGPGLARLAEHMTGRSYTAEDVFAQEDLATVLDVWCDGVASLVAMLARTIDPHVIVLGGGLGSRADVPARIVRALDSKLLANTVPPKLVTAKHGDASGALGAALYARDLAGRAI